MPIVSLNDIFLMFGPEKVFDHANLKLYASHKVGLIGPNGSGKTTLFRLILGKCQPDSGTVFVRKNIRIAYLPQQPHLEKGLTVRQALESQLGGIRKLEKQLAEVSAKMGESKGAELSQAMHEYERINHEMEISGAFDYNRRIEAALDGLDLPEDIMDKRVETLSGGQVSRLYLARVLVSQADLLLLDEPTNHLDLNMTTWLEGYLRSFSKALVVISHDRYLLDAVCNRTVEIETKKIVSWSGNYSDYVEAKEQKALHREREYQKRKEMVENTLDFIARNKNQEGMRKTAMGRKTRLERMLKENPDFLDRGAGPTEGISFNLDSPTGKSELVARCENLGKAFGDLKLFEDLTFDVLRGERFCITGPNGTGKSTLMKIALGQTEPDSGSIRLGRELKAGYLDQMGDTLDPKKTVLEQGRSVRPDLSEEKVRNMLGAFLFRGDDVFKPISALSGGQTNRLMLFCLMISQPDVILLDEPTNHLDIQSREALEQALDAYEGTIIAISHDRYFLDRVAERLLVIGESPEGHKQMGGFELYDSQEGVYSKYIETRTARAQHAREQMEKKKAKAKAAAKPDPNRGAAPLELKEFNKYQPDQIEEMILELEIEIEAMQEQFGDTEIYQNPEKLATLNEKFEAKKQRLDLLYRAYEYRS